MNGPQYADLELHPADPEPAFRFTDADKLRVLALWFDKWDAPETDRQAILDDPRNPGRNDVQRDLRRIAADLELHPADPDITETVVRDAPVWRKWTYVLLGLLVGAVVVLVWHVR